RACAPGCPAGSQGHHAEVAVARTQEVIPGLEVLARSRPRWLRRRRIGLLMHRASVTRRLESARDVLHRLCGPRLTALFGPQHGIAGGQEENMIQGGPATRRLS